MLALSLNRIAEQAEDTLVAEIGDPAVRHAARHLVARHRAGQTFDISAFDVPHAALADISGRLEEAGVSHAMSEPLIAALRRYIMSTGGSFVRAVNAKPVVIRLMVGDRMPDRRFENGMTELACIGSSETRVEGASSINVRATPTGTAMTSNAADVDAMFANVRGTHLWVRFEAPTKQDLDGLMSSMDAALAGVAQSVGGVMDADGFKALLEKLEAEGALTPAVQSLIENLIALQEGAGKLSADAVAEIVGNIAALIESAREMGLIPPELVQAVMTSMAELPENAAIADFLAEQGFESIAADNDNLSPEQKLEELMEKIEALQEIEGLDPETKEQIAELLEQAQEALDAENPDIDAVLAVLAEGLAELAANEGVPQALFDSIGEVLPEIASLQETAASAEAMEMPQGERLLEILEDIAAKIEAGEIKPSDVAPEIMELIGDLGGVETLLDREGRETRIETLSSAPLAENLPLAVVVQAAMPVLAEMKAIMPAASSSGPVFPRPAAAEISKSPVSAPMVAAGAGGWSASVVRSGGEGVFRPVPQATMNTPGIVNFTSSVPSFSVREAFMVVQAVNKNVPPAPKQESHKPRQPESRTDRPADVPKNNPAPLETGRKAPPSPVPQKPHMPPAPPPKRVEQSVPDEGKAPGVKPESGKAPDTGEKPRASPSTDEKQRKVSQSSAVESGGNDGQPPNPAKQVVKVCCIDFGGLPPAPTPEAMTMLEKAFEQKNRLNPDGTQYSIEGDNIVVVEPDGKKVEIKAEEFFEEVQQNIIVIEALKEDAYERDDPLVLTSGYVPSEKDDADGLKKKFSKACPCGGDHSSGGHVHPVIRPDHLPENIDSKPEKDTRTFEEVSIEEIKEDWEKKKKKKEMKLQMY